MYIARRSGATRGGIITVFAAQEEHQTEWCRRQNPGCSSFCIYDSENGVVHHAHATREGLCGALKQIGPSLRSEGGFLYPCRMVSTTIPQQAEKCKVAKYHFIRTHAMINMNGPAVYLRRTELNTSHVCV